MKRKATALFLLMITAIFTVRPVVAMHYCMGELRSFNLYQHHETSALCPEHGEEHGTGHATNPETVHDAGHACCAQASAPAHHAYTPSTDNCCDDTLLELSTDDYRNNTEPFISRLIPNPVTEGMMLLGNVLSPSVPETDSFPSMQEFPPEGLFLKDIPILTYLCIYRI